MPMQDYISEREAANVAGVSVATLNRFVETGYLQLEVDNDGVRLFSKNELQRLFNVTQLSPARSYDSENFVSSNNIQAQTVESETQDKSAQLHSDQSSQTNPPQTNQATETSQNEQSQKISLSEAAPNSEQSKAINYLEQEVSKFKRISELQERILDIREQQIQDLKSESNWLRQRIEKLEEKSSREQLILMANTETVRNLLLEHKRKSTLRAALEWFNIIPPDAETTKGSTIEVTRTSANQQHKQ